MGLLYTSIELMVSANNFWKITHKKSILKMEKIIFELRSHRIFKAEQAYLAMFVLFTQFFSINFDVSPSSV